MTSKDLKRLSRGDLLEMLLALKKENDRLRAELEEAKHQLQDRQIKIEDSKALAEAALQLNGVFEAAQKACDQYAENVRLRMERQEQLTREKCSAWIAQAKEQAGSYSWISNVMEEGK